MMFKSEEKVFYDLQKDIVAKSSYILQFWYQNILRSSDIKV